MQTGFDRFVINEDNFLDLIIIIYTRCVYIIFLEISNIFYLQIARYNHLTGINHAFYSKICILQI